MVAVEAPIRVVVLIDSLRQGGAEQSMMAILPGLADHGIAPELVLLRSVSAEREGALVDAGVPVRVIGHPNPLGLAVRVRSLLRDRRPALIHATLFDPIVAAGLASPGTGVPVLATQAITPAAPRPGDQADSAGHPRKVRAALAIEGFALRHLATQVHAVTPGVRDAVAERFRVDPARIAVVERGRDPHRFAPPTPEEHRAARAGLPVAPDAEVVVALGRHDPAKAFEDLISAIGRLASDRPRLRLLLAGREGTATDALRAAIDRNGVGDRVHLLGDRSDPERLLAAADVFVLSSRREGTSGATIEAMATGLPVVATDLEGMRGILVDGEQARLVPVGDPAALAAGIGEILDHPELAERLGAAGRATFESRFTLERSVEAMACLYREVATAGRGRKGRRAG